MKKPYSKQIISQAQNYAGEFGHVFRSSAIFWVKNDDRIRTTISIANYWKYKNNLDVTVILSLRTLEGKLRERLPIAFENTYVVNYSPPINFEGSAEVEAFSNKNMRIPYAASIVLYDCPKSLTMLHSYARAYSPHEIEEGRTINVGEESCWTVRESLDLVSFAVIHNGLARQPSQTATLRVRNALGLERDADIEVPELAPFETLVVEPSRHIENLADWLDGKPGNARISFCLNGGFTRMLCAIRKRDWSQLQVTHSNFDYSAQGTDTLAGDQLRSYMYTPCVPGARQREIIVYPDCYPGEYNVCTDDSTSIFRTGQAWAKLIRSTKCETLKFSSQDGVLPTRIVTGLRVYGAGGMIPAECSLGVIHQKRPPKHFHWMIIGGIMPSSIAFVDAHEIYGGCALDTVFCFKLYSPFSEEPLVEQKNRRDLPEEGLFSIETIFPNWRELGLAGAGTYGWLSIWCSYGGLMFFSILEKGNSLTMEHSF